MSETTAHGEKNRTGDGSVKSGEDQRQATNSGLRRDGWELENIRHRDAAMFCACELRPRVIRTRCTKRNQLESTWDLCRAQGTQGLGYVCEFVGSIADDPMTKNIQNSTGCNATIIRGSVTGQSISVISNVDNIRRRLQRAMKETGLLNPDKMLRRLGRCLYGTRQAARSWQREIEKGIKAAGMVIGEMSKCSFKSPCGKLVGVVHGVDNPCFQTKGLNCRLVNCRLDETRAKWP